MSFRLKTILGIAAIEAVLLAILIWSSLGYLRSSNEEELARRAQAVARLFATMSQGAVLATDLATLEHAVQEVLTNPGVEYARVRGRQGIVLAAGGRPELLQRPFRADQGFDSQGDGILDVAADIAASGTPYGRVEIGIATASLQDLLAAARGRAALIAALEMGLVALFSFALGSYLTRGLVRLQRASRRIAAGELGFRLDAGGSDELAETAHAFNEMAQHLEESATRRRQAEEELARHQAQLEHLVARRTEELTQANSDLQQSNRQLAEAQRQLVSSARKAGMAEVASNVLHNVGNVLNSVNISTGHLSDMVRASKVQGLANAVDLMNQHAGDLGDFLLRNEKGKLLPGYLGKLAEALAAERQQLLEELADLGRSVDHLKEVVAVQQSYAGVSIIVEPVRLADLLEDALRINGGAFTRHRVTVVKAFSEMPALLLDRHRLLSILLNLLSNAKNAAPPAADHQHLISLHLELTQGATLRIQVTDNGEGILPENLTRIFAHGFTTRKNGHGFGLHSCALAAKEMGGTLTAHSDGPGKGATFILELPAKTAEPEQ
jgi:signal transduction histidine kinase